jgi:hypothetical protein
MASEALKAVAVRLPAAERQLAVGWVRAVSKVEEPLVEARLLADLVLAV